MFSRVKRWDRRNRADLIESATPCHDAQVVGPGIEPTPPDCSGFRIRGLRVSKVKVKVKLHFSEPSAGIAEIEQT